MTKRTSWEDLTPLTPAVQAAHDDEERVAAFRGFIYQLRNDAGLTKRNLPSAWVQRSQPLPEWKVAVFVQRL
jgi:hypothetical protein